MVCNQAIVLTALHAFRERQVALMVRTFSEFMSAVEVHVEPERSHTAREGELLISR